MRKLILSGLSAGLILGGAAGILVGTLGPWAHVTLFQNIGLSLSGLLFADGGLCLGAALLVLLGMRRSPILCLLTALLVLHWTAQAHLEVPRVVKHQVIGAQLALFPLNRLLDQFHIADVEVANWAIPDAQLLASGLNWATEGALALLLGSLLGLPYDPVVGWVSLRAVPARCRNCGARWSRTRQALFCPCCGANTALVRTRRCTHCGTEAASSDHYCVACGQSLGGIKGQGVSA